LKGNSDDAKKILNILLTRPKYITVAELRTQARVTDKMRKDNPEWLSYDRNSMKNYIRKILLTKEVELAVKKHCNNAEENESDEEVVSIFTVC
jgi:predicted transposase YbfD/YdcC